MRRWRLLTAVALSLGALVMGTLPASAAGTTIMTAQNATLGTILTNGAGMTLYWHANDPANGSVCTGTCATYWPPLTVTGTPTAASGATGTLTTFKDPAGQMQVAYNGHALYTFVADKKAGDTVGDGKNGFGGVWHVATATLAAATAAPTTAAPAASAAGTTIMTAQNATLGTILTNGAGMTLYWHANDPASGSVCTGTCATYWPPLTVSGTPTAASGVTGKLTTFKDPAGQMQVAYNGHALYTFVADKKAGDTVGEGKNGFGGVWHVATPTLAAAAPTTTSAKLPKTGTGPWSYAGGVLLILGGLSLLIRRRTRAG